MTDMIQKEFMMTNDKASQKLCPYTLEGTAETCCPNTCMAWVEAFHEHQREDHSGGADMIREEARKRRVPPVRTGPPGSSGYWTVPAVGFCKRLWKEMKYE